MWARTHDGLRRDPAAAEHGVVEDADGVADRTHQVRGLLHGDVEIGAEDLDRRLVAGDPLDGLADRLRGAAGVRRDEQRVVRLHAQRLTHLGVDDRVDLRDLRGVGADGHPRGVAAAAEAQGALLARHPLLELGHERELSGGHPVPLLLQLGARGGRVVAVGGGVDRGEVDGAVLDADLGHRQPLDAAHPVEPADPVDHVVGEGLLAEHQDVGVPQRALARPDALARLGRRRRLARLARGRRRRTTGWWRARGCRRRRKRSARTRAARGRPPPLRTALPRPPVQGRWRPPPIRQGSARWEDPLDR